MLFIITYIHQLKKFSCEKKKKKWPSYSLPFLRRVNIIWFSWWLRDSLVSTHHYTTEQVGMLSPYRKACICVMLSCSQSFYGDKIPFDIALKWSQIDCPTFLRSTAVFLLFNSLRLLSLLAGNRVSPLDTFLATVSLRFYVTWETRKPGL